MALCGLLMASNTYSCVFWKLFYNKYINHTYIYTHLFEIKIPVNIIHRNFPTKKEKKIQVFKWHADNKTHQLQLIHFLLRLGIVLMKCNPTRISSFFFLTWLHMKIEGIFAKNPPTKIHLAKFQGKSSYRNWYCKCTLINQHGMTRVNFCIHLWTTTSMKILVGFIKANKLNTSNRTLHHNSFEKWSSGKSTSLIEDEKWLSTLQDWNPSMKF